MRLPLTTIRAALAAFAITTSLPDAGRAAEAETRAFEDASKLVTIGGSLTEIVYALGEEDRLVARDTTSVYPAEALRLPDVGYMRQLSPEGVLSVGPSAILALADSGPPETIAVLKKASVPIVIVPESFDRQGILRKIRIVGGALDIGKEAEALAARIDADLRSVERRAAAIAERKRVMFILTMQGGRIMASGTGTAAAGMIAMAGGVNAVEGFAGYRQLTEEAVIDARPDVILMMDRAGAPALPADQLFANAALATTPAAGSHALIHMDGAYMLGFGPRTADAVRDLSAALYGAAMAN